MTVIVADIGATNARFALIKNGKLSDIYRFSCDDFKNPVQIIESFFHGYAPEAKYILAGVPGAVFDNKVKWTNRPWSLDGTQLKRKLRLKEVVLMNDVQVQGAALSSLTQKDFTFLRGKNLKKGPRVLINVGTGLGACYIIDNKIFSSEYGQTMLERKETLETLVSGPAFKKLYKQVTDGTELISAMKIAELCLKGDQKAIQTYTYFYEVLARAVMNIALTIKATGGVYLCGGILDEKTLKHLKFAQHFCTHPKMGELLKTIPVVFIKKKDFAFLGLKMLAKKYGWS